ncbi:hypothetical protein H5410_055711 [Solanum commersonii]|uniref:Uncharacterized protein n=1 Tax=Solanum commersonii TaxID=4109 RepID=A0A9J5WIB2_SOLCO|nr:hypothetical protein H5410_055711 [Solanum commersonii]
MPDVENYEEHVLQVENENATKTGHWLHTKIQLVVRPFSRLVEIILHVVERVLLRIFWTMRRNKILVMAQKTYYVRITLKLYLRLLEKNDNTMTPTLYISNPEVAKIIQENQDVMLLKSNPTIKPFMATLNTSTHKISPSSLESLGESR